MKPPNRRSLGSAALALAVVALPACGGGLQHPTREDAAFASARWPGTSVEMLAEGRRLYVRRCGTCHRLHEPSEFPEAEWRTNLVEMRERAKVRPDEEELMLKYLVAVGSPRAGGTQ